MKGATVFYFAVVFFYTITQGADINPSDESSWSAFECIKSLQQNILELQETVTNQAAQLNETQANLKNLQNSTVPIGFIYVQLPDQPEPHHLWETMIWTDISSEYAGLFFRVLGGASEQFNVEQPESSPRISQVQTNVITARRFDINIPSSGWSLQIASGATPPPNVNVYGLRFFQSTEEIRPRNKAIRIWKRMN